VCLFKFDYLSALFTSDDEQLFWQALCFFTCLFMVGEEGEREEGRRGGGV